MTAWSGIPFQILRQLRLQDADVHVLSPLRTRTKYLLSSAKLLASAKGQSLTLDHFSIVLRAYAKQIEAFVKDSSIDVIFSPSTIPITLVGCGKPIVTWTDAVFHAMHEYYSDTFSKMTKAGVNRGKWQEEKALNNCSIAAFASTWALNGARQLTEASKLRMLPFGSSLPVHHTAEDVTLSAAEKRSTRKNACELLFVGVNWKRKGGDIAVETARLLNEAGIQTKLRIVGSQPERDLPSFVEVLGFINKSTQDGMHRLIDLFQRSDFFILPTKAEAAGIVFSEASSYGLPSLAYATGGVPDYLRDGVNGVCVVTGEPAARFATEIQRILINPEEYGSYAVGAFREYRERLNWETSVSRLIEICSNALDT